MRVRPALPDETVLELNAVLKDAGERFRAGDTAGSRELAERAWNRIPEPKYDWDFFPGILIRHMVTLAVADRDEPRLRHWIDELYGVYRDPSRQDPFTVSIEADALHDIGLAEESAKAWTRIKGGVPAMPPPATARPEVDDTTHARIEGLTAEGDDATDADDFERARRAYSAALSLLPEPKDRWVAWTWLESAIGDTYFFEGRWTDCQTSFERAVAGPDGLGNPLIHLRLGQCAVELGNEDRAKDELLRAYMGAGRPIFEDERKYLDFLERRVDIRSVR